ncbi:unnamed protein product [Caenorhabditis bovis]|uniref:U5 small nuclear ribonucleoprotein 40 kDa protein n=1 Tax=Caenorhabditis bovis TaxID=2654633 RepID=A0A8S1EM71_9PELO|nr:unnamed protein product [Caenorhabditis bovis]
MALVRSNGAQMMAAGDPMSEVPRLSNLQAPTMALYGHQGEIYTAQFSPDGTCLASSGYDMQIFLWNVFGDCENFAVLKGHKGAVMDLKFNTDSSMLMTASTDKTVRIWDMETGACVRKFKSHTDIVNALHPSRRGVQLVVSASDDGSLKVFDIRTREPVKNYANKYQQTAVTFNDTTDQIFCGGIDNEIKGWDMRRDDIALSLQGHRDTITSIALSPNGNFIISNAMDCSVKQWDIRPFAPGQRLVNTFYGHQHNFEKNLLKCSWSPDNRYISAGSSDRFVYVWEVLTKKLEFKLPGHLGSVNATDFHPNEPILLSAGSDKKLFLGEIDMS